MLDKDRSRFSLVSCLVAALSAISQACWAREQLPAPADSIHAALQPFVDRHALAGAVVLVADKNKVLSLEAVGSADVAAGKPMGQDALFWIASQSKPMTATAFMMLVDEGKIRLDDPVEKYLPEFKGQWLAVEQDKDHVLLKRPKHPITVREILSHTSGLPFTSAMEAPTLDLLSLRDGVRSYAMTPLQFEPGSKYAYSNAGINTAGRIIEVVSGVPYEEFMQKRLFDPLGMKDTTFWPDEGQLAPAGEVLQAQRGEDGPRGNNGDTTPVSTQRPHAAADAGGRVVLDGPGPRAVLPDDAGTRGFRGKALSLGSRRGANDRQADGPPEGRLRAGMGGWRRRVVRTRGRLLHKHVDRPGAGSSPSFWSSTRAFRATAIRVERHSKAPRRHSSARRESDGT